MRKAREGRLHPGRPGGGGIPATLSCDLSPCELPSKHGISAFSGSRSEPLSLCTSKWVVTPVCASSQIASLDVTSLFLCKLPSLTDSPLTLPLQFTRRAPPGSTLLSFVSVPRWTGNFLITPRWSSGSLSSSRNGIQRYSSI